MSTEYVDILDEDGNLTGLTKERSDTHRHGDWHRTVHVWIVNAGGEVLIQKRSPLKDRGANKWDMSCAGHISAGKKSPDTVIQEVKEELGLTVTPEQLEYLFSVKEEDGTTRHFHDVFLISFDFDINKVKIQKEEVSEVKKLPYADLEKEIHDSSDAFTDHQEEYERIFTILKERNQPC